ncbi:MAG: hypothetical protein U0794_09920 [Isosphaeraceae bacterium]
MPSITPAPPQRRDRSPQPQGAYGSAILGSWSHRGRASHRLAAALLALSMGSSLQAQAPDTRTAPPSGEASSRRVPEALNFANGLFRERRYEMAATEYERFLREGKPTPSEAAEARFGLANSRLFQGE